ncbi:MAG: PIN-like domain-containing protein [Bacteroidota bacterium]|nr:PIN-like domain-containing protein [Bacteroidota bacterium]
MSESKNIQGFNDPFIRNKKYPKAESIFSFQYKGIDEIKDNCIFILDTPVLLYLYEARHASIHALHEVYQELISLNRLFVPAQVAREFADLKGDFHKQLQGFIKNKLHVAQPKFESPLSKIPSVLQSFPEFDDMVRIEKEIKHELANFRFKILLADYQQKLNSLMNSSETWLWNDPITSIYKDLFKNQVVVELNNLKDRKAEIEEEVGIRHKHEIPPVYKVENTDEGLGNYLIWEVILQLGKDLNTNVVFVTSNNNSNWVKLSDGKQSFPYHELSYEFTAETKGKSFNTISLSGLLNMFKLDQAIVKDIEGIENKKNKKSDAPLGIEWVSCSDENLQLIPEQSGVYLFANKEKQLVAISSARSLKKKIQKYISKNSFSNINSLYFGYHLIDDYEVAKVVAEQLKEKYMLE